MCKMILWWKKGRTVFQELPSSSVFLFCARRSWIFKLALLLEDTDGVIHIGRFRLFFNEFTNLLHDFFLSLSNNFLIGSKQFFLLTLKFEKKNHIRYTFIIIWLSFCSIEVGMFILDRLKLWTSLSQPKSSALTILTVFSRVSVQGVKSLGSHFTCLCREFDF